MSQQLPLSLSLHLLPPSLGVLSFFALQGGARKVYSVEASNMSKHCSQLAKANKFEDRMAVIAAKIEEVCIMMS